MNSTMVWPSKLVISMTSTHNSGTTNKLDSNRFLTKMMRQPNKLWLLSRDTLVSRRRNSSITLLLIKLSFMMVWLSKLDTRTFTPRTGTTSRRRPSSTITCNPRTESHKPGTQTPT